ncbi:FkbM family methyltransferase [Akkermansiaceae bacterium]|nr:FkbM family methyltransferase [Akkermansiaceae bacterium]MDB4499030.1 FkbM family methyltransferase [Akkermansiaceae bacterium]
MKMNAILKFTSNPAIPLTLRREVGKLFVKQNGESFEIEIDGRPFPGTLDNYIEWMVFITRDYFEYTYLNLIRSLVKGGVALDVGGNIGNHAHAFAGFFDEVHSFEPFEKVAKRLKEKAALLGGVTVHSVALSDEAGEMSFEAPDSDNWGTGRISDSGGLKVQVVRGDDYLKEQGIGKPNFIKIDVEGHEPNVLRGLKKTIAESRPVVMFEAPRHLRKEGNGGLGEMIECFPEDYQFVGFRGQTTFPVQRKVAKTIPLDVNRLEEVKGKITYVLGFGKERGFEL